jgi:hypothetical protein
MWNLWKLVLWLRRKYILGAVLVIGLLVWAYFAHTSAPAYSALMLISWAFWGKVLPPISNLRDDDYDDDDDDTDQNTR